MPPTYFLHLIVYCAGGHWSIYEREACAAVQAFRKLDYVLAFNATTLIITDHQKVLFFFSLFAMESSPKRHRALNLVLWALYFGPFNSRTEHVLGAFNARPDIITRLMRGYRKSPAVHRVAPAIPFSNLT